MASQISQGNYLTNEISNIQNNLNTQINNIKDSTYYNPDQNGKLSSLGYQIDQQSNLINEINNSIMTKARMLQIAQERNEYKKKMIYTLIAIIALIIIISLVLYTLFFTK